MTARFTRFACVCLGLLATAIVGSTMAWAADIVTMTLTSDKTSAKRGDTVTFTAALKNTDSDQVVSISCTATYSDPSTGTSISSTSNQIQLTRLGWVVVAPVLAVPANASLQLLMSSFTQDGTAVSATSDGSGGAKVTLSDLAAGQTRTVKWQATAK